MAFYFPHDVVHVVGFAKITESADLGRKLFIDFRQFFLWLAIAREKYNFLVFVRGIILYPHQGFHAVYPRHLQVQHDQIWIYLLKFGYALFAAAGLNGVKTSRAKADRHNVAEILGIIDQKYQWFRISH